MALDSANIWGKAVADAIAAIGITAGTPVSATQLEAVWTAVKTEDRSQLTTKMTAVAPTGGAPHAPGGTVAITLPPASFL